MQKIAVNGAWQDERKYQLRIYFYEMPARMNYTFSFDKSTVIWKSQLEHSLLGERDIEVLKGKLLPKN